MNTTFDSLFRGPTPHIPLSGACPPPRPPDEATHGSTQRESARAGADAALRIPSLAPQPGLRRKRTFKLAADVDQALSLAVASRINIHGNNKSEIVEALLRLHGYVPGGTVR